MHLSDKKVVELIDLATKDFHGDTRTLSNAIGYLMIGRQFGWKPMLLMHDRKTIKNYELLLKFDSKDVMPEIGPLETKSIAWVAVQKAVSFWKAVKLSLIHI